MVATPWCCRKRHASSWKPPLHPSLWYAAAPESSSPAPAPEAAAVAQLSSGCGLSAAGAGPAAAKADAACTQKRSDKADAALTAQQLPHCACTPAARERAGSSARAACAIRSAPRGGGGAAMQTANGRGRGLRIARRATPPPLAPGARLVEHDVGAAVEGVARVEARRQARRVGDVGGCCVCDDARRGSSADGERKQQETGAEDALSHGGARRECRLMHRQRANKKALLPSHRATCSERRAPHTRACTANLASLPFLGVSAAAPCGGTARSAPWAP